MTNRPITTDRSRTECYQVCPRKRYWQYEHSTGAAVRGLERDTFSLDLFFGQCAHWGLEAMLRHAEKPETVEAAVAFALGEWKRGLVQRGVAALDPDSAELMGALLEGLLRGWATVRLPEMLEQYEVLDVEREEEFPLGEDIRFLSRLDGLVRRRSDGAVFVWSFKTAGVCDERWAEQLRYDNQSVSEVLAAEHRLGQRVDGVIIAGLVKGQKRAKWRDGWHHSSPLLWGWVKLGQPPLSEDELSAEYQRTKGWERFETWRAKGGVAAWVEWLSLNAPTLLAEQFPVLSPILRSDWERERWKRTTEAQEMRVWGLRGALEALMPAGREAALDVYFPMHTGSNCVSHYGKRCGCFDLCHGSAAQEPLESGYRVRTANHPQEAK